MYDFVIAAAFVIIPVIIISISVVIGLKRNAFQSAIKLLLTIIAIVISSILAKTFVQSVLDTVMSIVGNFADDNIMIYLNTSKSARDIIHIIEVLSLPIVFFALFIVIKFICFLLNLIPGNLLSDKAFIRRQRIKSVVTVPDSETIYSDTYNQNNAYIETEYAPFKTKQSMITSKVISVFCCVLSAFLVMSSLALPINAYTKYGSMVIDYCEDILESDSDLEDVAALITTVHEHPVNKCYTFVNGLTLRSLESFENHKGKTISFSDALSTTLSILNDVTQWNADSISSQNIYDLADMIENDPFAKDFVTTFVAELCEAWEAGESFLGIQTPDRNNPIADALLKELSSFDDITRVLRAAADVLKIKDVVQLNGNELNTETAKLMATQIFDSISPDSIDLMKTVISDELLTDLTDIPPSVATHISDFTGYVLDGIIEIKNNPDYSASQTAELFEKEALALSTIINMTSNPEEVDANVVVSAIVESSIIAETIQDVTKDGEVHDPYQIGNMISTDFKEKVKGSLDDYGISENSDTYKSLIAFIG